jgi:hypothetical protein
LILQSWPVSDYKIREKIGINKKPGQSECSTIVESSENLILQSWPVSDYKRFKNPSYGHLPKSNNGQKLFYFANRSDPELVVTPPETPKHVEESSDEALPISSGHYDLDLEQASITANSKTINTDLDAVDGFVEKVDPNESRKFYIQV